MTTEEIRQRVAAIHAEKRNLISEADASSDIEEVRGINAKLDQLNNELMDLDEQFYEALDQSQRSAPIGAAQILGTYGMRSVPQSQTITNNNEVRNMILTPEMKTKYEQRGVDLKEHKAVSFDMDELDLRAITLSSGDLTVTTYSSDQLNPGFNGVSSVVDDVHVVPLHGGEAYQKGFVVSYGEGGYTTETDDYVDAEPVFDYVSTGKSKITAYAELSDAAGKLPSVQYAMEVRKGITQAIRKKIGRQIMIGAGGENAITGIFHAPEKVIPAATDLEISQITADTLDELVLGYGGSEDVEGIGYLILNKSDLAAFAALRDAEGRKLYEISINGNTGEITSKGSFKVPYIINSACPALSAADTLAGTYCMAYGKLQAYELPIFSPLEVAESRDFKFKSGHVAYRGVIWVGGTVAAYQGFIRVKKK